MKTINYLKSSGSFIIKYLDDDEIIRGTINIDEKSIKTDLKKYIIDNEEGATFIYKTYIGNNYSEVEILLVKKEIELVFDEVNDEKYIFNLLLRIINVSIQTVDIVESLPKLNFD